MRGVAAGMYFYWFSSYLHGRQQRVTALGATSSTKTVGSGVPQGSILGPILFLLYVNDLPDVIENSSVASFANDTKIFRCIDSINDTASLQVDLQNLDSWSCSSGLVFNELKCKCMHVTRKTDPIIYPYNINNRELTKTSTEKDLGIWVSNNLTWTKHVVKRCTKANKMLGFVKRNGAEISNIITRRTLYLSVVRPVLGYGTQVWCPQSISLVRRTERIQRRASKFILKLLYMCIQRHTTRD